MFEVWWNGQIKKVYSVDFTHDALLISVGSKFKWVPMNDCKPLI